VKRFATFRAELINPSRARALNSRSNADSSIKLDRSRASNVIRRLPILSTPVDRQDRWRRRRKRERSSRVSIIARDAVRCIARVKARDGRDGLSRWTVTVRFILLYAQSLRCDSARKQGRSIQSANLTSTASAFLRYRAFSEFDDSRWSSSASPSRPRVHSAARRRNATRVRILKGTCGL